MKIFLRINSIPIGQIEFEGRAYRGIERAFVFDIIIVVNYSGILATSWMPTIPSAFLGLRNIIFGGEGAIFLFPLNILKFETRIL